MNQKSKHFTKSLSFKLISIGVVIIVLLYPMYKIQGLISERDGNRLQAQLEVGEMWGGEQILEGPVVIVPYWHYERINDEVVRMKRQAKFLPEKLKIEGEIFPESLSRSIYEIIVYSSELRISGNIYKPDIEKLGIDDKEAIWEEAQLQISVSDIRGVKENVVINWNGQSMEFVPGVEASEVFSNGLSIPLIFKEDVLNEFTYTMKLNGSKNLSFLPLANETKVKITSSWASPSFTGEYVPYNREINDDGFLAEWGVLSLNRTFPQQWKDIKYTINESAFGVSLYQPVNLYQKSTRSAKYAILIIFLTFLTFFIIENLGKHLVHPVQYGMVGLGLIIFYTLLLSLSEYIEFHWAYLIASSMITLTIAGYSASLFESFKRGLLVAVFIAFLYLFIFIIIQSEDYSLLIGSFGLYLTLAVAMYFSRKINWYKDKSHEITKEASFSRDVQ